MISALTHASTMVSQWRFSVKTCHETEVRWRGPGNIDSYGAPVRGTRAEPHAEAYERASSAKRKARNGQRDFKKGQEETSPIPMSFTHTQHRRKGRSYGRRRGCTRRNSAHKASEHGGHPAPGTRSGRRSRKRPYSPLNRARTSSSTSLSATTMAVSPAYMTVSSSTTSTSSSSLGDTATIMLFGGMGTDDARMPASLE